MDAWNSLETANVTSVVQLLRLCKGAKGLRRFVFLSTDILDPAGDRSETAPRAMADEVTWWGGYQQTKWASEGLLLAAAKAGVAAVTVVRMGMVTPNRTTGAANVTDWLMRVVVGSMLVGATRAQPEAVLHSTPVDYVADFLAQMASRQPHDQFIIVHVPQRPVAEPRA